MNRRGQGPQHVRSYLLKPIILGIIERRHVDHNAAKIVASWISQGFLTPDLLQ